MKFNNKILSFLVTVSMLITTPVSAENEPTASDYEAPYGVNLFEEWGCNWNYDTIAAQTRGLYGYSNMDINLNASVGSVTFDDVSGINGGGKRVNGANSKDNRQRVNFIPVEEGAIYRLSVDVKLNDDTSADTMKWNPEFNTNQTKVKPEKIAETVSVTNSEWSTVSYTYKGVATDAASPNRMHFHMGLYANSASSYMIDNWTLTKIAPPPEITATVPKANSVDLELNTAISITFDKAVSLGNQNISISSGELGTVSTDDNKTFTIPVTGQIYGAEYTVTLKDIVSLDGGLLENYTFSYTTAEKILSEPYPDDTNINLGSNLLADAGFNWNLELDSDPRVNIPPVYTDGDYVQTSKTEWGNNGTVTYEVVTNVDAPDGTSAKGALLVSGRGSATASRRINHIAIMPDKTYRAAVWIKLRDENATANASIDLNCPSASKVVLSKYSPETFVVNGREWTKVYADFTTSLRDAEDIARGRFHMGYKTDNYSGDLYVDGFSFCEIRDDVLTVENGTVENEILKIRFTSKVPEANFTAENVEINNGGEVEKVTRINDVQYEVSFKNLRHSTEYTVTIRDVNNIGTGVLNSFSVTFITDEKSPIVDVFTKDPSFESEEWGIANCDHWCYSTEEYVHGTKSLKNSGCGCSAAQVSIQNIRVEPSTDYVLTFWAKHEGLVQIRLRNQSEGNAFLTESFKLTKGDGKWTKYALPFTTPDTMKNLRLYIPASDKVLYLDDFSLYKAPGEINISTSLNSENVQVDMQEILLSFTNEIDESIDLTNVSDYFTIDNGAVITSAIKGVDNASVILTLGGRFKPSTTYTITVKNIFDYVCQDLGERIITFTTEPEFKFERPFAFTQANKIDVSVSARSDNLQIPVVMYIVYDENGNKVGELVSSSTGEEVLGFEQGFEFTSDAISLRSGEYAVAYMFKAADDLTLTAQPVGLGKVVSTGTSECVKPENVKLITKPSDGKIILRGNAEPGSTVSAILIESDSSVNVANGAAYKGAGNKRDYTVAELTGGTDVVSLIRYINHSVAQTTARMASVAETGANGVFEIELDAEPVAGSTGTLYGVALSGDGITAFSILTGVYMPAIQEFADALNAINTATNTEEMKSAIDRYGAVLQLDITNAVYATDGEDIAKAILATKNGNYTKETLAAVFDDVSLYCTRQREALSLLNTANNGGITEALTKYSDVLGYYENGIKLNFGAKYNQFGVNGEYVVNQQLISMRDASAFSSMNDFITRFNSLTPTVMPQGGGGGGGSSGGKLSGNTVGAAPVTPGVSLPVSEPLPVFSDISDVQWAREAIENLANRGIIGGMGDGSFAPHSFVTREQFVKMFIQLFGIPTASGESFSDVDSGMWYAPFVYGAAKTGVVSGISETEFGTGRSITRQDIVTIIYRMMVKLDTFPEKVSDVVFKDSNDIEDYASEAVITLAEAGIINGVSDGIFAPLERATRAQTAVVLDRLYNTYIDVYFK